MILAIDVGNTNITVGAFEGKKLTATFRVTTKIPRTSDEYGMILRQLLLLQGSEAPVTDGVIIASVVPNVMHSLISGIIKYIGVEPLIAGPGIKTGIRIDTPSTAGP